MAEPMLCGPAWPPSYPENSKQNTSSPNAGCRGKLLKLQVQGLLNQQLYESAVILGSFLLSPNEDVDNHELSDYMALFGDALQGSKEYKRAVAYYRKAIHLLRLAPQPGSASKACSGPLPLSALPVAQLSPCGFSPSQQPTAPFAARPSAPPGAPHPIARPGAAAEGCTAAEAGLSYKIARCFQELRDWKSAVAELECVPGSLRTSTLSASLGQLYRRLGYNKLSVIAYKECLLQNPLAIEAAVALADLGVPYDEILLHSPLLNGQGLADACARAPSSAHASPAAEPHQPGSAPWMAPSSCAPQEDAPRGRHQGHDAGPAGPSDSAESPNPWAELPAVSARVDYSGAAGRGEPGAARGRPRCSEDDAGAEQMSPSSPQPGTRSVSGQKEHQRHAGERIGGKDACAVKLGSRLSKRRRTSTRGAARRQAGADDNSLPQNHSNNFAPPRAASTPSKPPAGKPAARISGAARPEPACFAAAPQPAPAGVSLSTPPGEGEADEEAGHAQASTSPACQQAAGPEPGWAWLTLLVRGHAAMFAQAHLQAAEAFNQLAELFPNELSSLLGAAHAQLGAGDQAGAVATFQRVRLLDPLNVRGMDSYAALLLDLKLDRELRKLSHDMTDMDSSLPEVWAIMACFWQMKQNWDKALEYVDRGLQLRSDHFGLRLSRGRCLLQKKLLELAVAEFRAVLGSRNDIVAFHGLVMACLQGRKFQEAMVHARQATKLLPTHAAAACLLGFVHLQSPTGKVELAKKWLRRALMLDPSSREAAVALVAIFVQEAAWPEAVAVLEGQLQLQPTDFMHLKLGEIHRDAGNLDKAIDNFQVALGLNPYNKLASAALEAMERRDLPEGSAAQSSVAWPPNTSNALEFNDAMMEEAN